MPAPNAPRLDTPAVRAASLSTEMTAAEAAARVKRAVVIQEPTVKGPDGKWLYRSVVVQQAIAADEVLRFKDYGTHVVVVTTDGQKFSTLE